MFSSGQSIVCCASHYKVASPRKNKAVKTLIQISTYVIIRQSLVDFVPNPGLCVVYFEYLKAEQKHPCSQNSLCHAGEAFGSDAIM